MTYLDKLVKIIAVLTLIVVSISAIGGGAMLILDPTGASMQLDLELLSETHFQNYLLPGIILALIVGAGSGLILVFYKNKLFPTLITLQGVLLVGWLSIELILKIEFYDAFLHMSSYSAALILILCGAYLRYKQ
jgi:hypothetical protein